tara:strand:- start:526 stop:753 length:228 start_codon:yes stop_codon:yes gene_type:complete
MKARISDKTALELQIEVLQEKLMQVAVDNAKEVSSLIAYGSSEVVIADCKSRAKEKMREYNSAIMAIKSCLPSCN